MTKQQKDIIVYLMLNASGITVAEAVLNGMGTDLRKRISELKRLGYSFDEIIENNKTNSGHHKRWYLKGSDDEKN